MFAEESSESEGESTQEGEVRALREQLEQVLLLGWCTGMSVADEAEQGGARGGAPGTGWQQV